MATAPNSGCQRRRGNRRDPPLECERIARLERSRVAWNCVRPVWWLGKGLVAACGFDRDVPAQWVRRCCRFPGNDSLLNRKLSHGTPRHFARSGARRRECRRLGNGCRRTVRHTRSGDVTTQCLTPGRGPHSPPRQNTTSPHGSTNFVLQDSSYSNSYSYSPMIERRGQLLEKFEDEYEFEFEDEFGKLTTPQFQVA